jgi:drug/metabolite transporter (DMT)-like permease
MLDIPPEMYKPLFYRCLGGFFSEILLYMAFAQTQYSKAICIFFTNTLMIPFFAKCILGEKVIKWDLIAITIGFIGMILIV